MKNIIGNSGLLVLLILLIYANVNQFKEDKNKIDLTTVDKIEPIVDNQVESSFPDDIFDWVSVSATRYHAVEKECDINPLITADGSRISSPRKTEKWIAVSRDLLEIFSYGDRVYIECEDSPEINGIYEIHDTMHGRFKNKIDILSSLDYEGKGAYPNVRIKKVE